MVIRCSIRASSDDLSASLSSGCIIMIMPSDSIDRAEWVLLDILHFLQGCLGAVTETTWVCIMRPNTEPPVLSSYEISVKIHYAEVVYCLDLSRVHYLLKRHPATVVASKQIAWLKFSRW